VFKVLRIQSGFEVVCNLRDLPTKQLNLNYSNNDVQFNPRDGESIGIHERLHQFNTNLHAMCL